VPITEKQLAANRANAAPPAMPALTASPPPPSPSSISKRTSPPSTSPSTPRNCSPSSGWPSRSRRCSAPPAGKSGLFTNCLDLALKDNGTSIALMSRELAGDGDIEITRAQNRHYALADGFDRMARQPANRPSATTAAPWRNSTGSKRFGPNYQTNPFWRSNSKKTNPLVPHRRNPFQPPNPTPSRLRLSRYGCRGGAAPCAAQSARAIEGP
jgi:hypothetical protein